MTTRNKTAIRIGSLVAASVALVIAGVVWQGRRSGATTSSYRIEAVTRGPLSVVVNATGTIEPEEVVDIGAQVIGMIKEFGVDPQASGKPIDYLSEVEEGTILARIDDSVYQTRYERAAAFVEQAKAQCDQAKVNVTRAEADLGQSKATLQKAERDWKRAEQLKLTQTISDADHDAVEAAFEVGKADVRIAEAAIEQQRAALRLSEKALAVAEADRREAQRNLDYTVIRSPVKGVIVDRRVNIGQTVVSSLNAPSLFLIAKDLKKLQVWASVNEADVGRIRKGQAVRFSVDAFPNEFFVGKVNQIRLNAAMTQNVVTYTVIVETDNLSGKLLPYLTANLQFEIERRSDALLVSNAALRWQPLLERVAPEFRAAFDRSAASATASSGTSGGPPAAIPPHEQAVVWTPEGPYVRPVVVRVGLSDGVSTEILSGDLEAGRPLVVGDESEHDQSETVSPFAPQMFGGGRR